MPAPGPCRAVNDILSRVGDQWSVLIIMSLRDGTPRFNELKRRTDGILQRMLTLTLQPIVPPAVCDRLTDLGRPLRGPVSALGRWAIEHRGTVEQARTRCDARSMPS